MQKTQGHGTFSRDLPSGLASYRSQNLDILTQNTMLAMSKILKGSQGSVNLSFEFFMGLANHGSQNRNVGVNNPITTTWIEQNESHNADPFEWVRKFLLEDFLSL